MNDPAKRLWLEQKPLAISEVKLVKNGRADFTIAYCGLNCAKCGIYHTGHGNEGERNEILAWFRENRNKILKPEQVRCEECRGQLVAHWSEDCKIMLCAKGRKIQHCFQREDFPCIVLNEFSSDGDPSHKKGVESLHEIRHIGVGAWIAEERKNEKSSLYL